MVSSRPWFFFQNETLSNSFLEPSWQLASLKENDPRDNKPEVTMCVIIYL